MCSTRGAPGVRLSVGPPLLRPPAGRICALPLIPRPAISLLGATEGMPFFPLDFPSTEHRLTESVSACLYATPPPPRLLQEPRHGKGEGQLNGLLGIPFKSTVFREFIKGNDEPCKIFFSL